MTCDGLKIRAVQYYLESNKSIREVSEIFGVKRASLSRWVKLYQNNKITEINRVSISYKIKQKHIKKALAILKKNEQITMKELCIIDVN